MSETRIDRVVHGNVIRAPRCASNDGTGETWATTMARPSWPWDNSPGETSFFQRAIHTRWAVLDEAEASNQSKGGREGHTRAAIPERKIS